MDSFVIPASENLHKSRRLPAVNVVVGLVVNQRVKVVSVAASSMKRAQSAAAKCTIQEMVVTRRISKPRSRVELESLRDDPQEAESR